MDAIPLTLLENILGFLPIKDLSVCCLVSCLWNEAAAKIRRESCWVSFSGHIPDITRSGDIRSSQETVGSNSCNSNEIYKFIHAMERTKQDTPFERFRIPVYDENLEALKTFLSSGSSYIKYLDLSLYQEKNTAECFYLFKSLTSDVMPCLQQLTVYYAKGVVIFPDIPLKTLTKIKLPRCHIGTRFNVPRLLKFAPNLQELAIDTVNVNFENDVSPVWPFPDEYNQIPVIKIQKLKFLFGEIELLTRIRRFMDTVRRIQANDICYIINGAPIPGILNEARAYLTQILELQSEYIENLEVISQYRIDTEPFPYNLELPLMKKLKTLVLDFNTNLNILRPIDGRLFPVLREVTLKSYSEPNILFRSTILPSVKIFHLHDNSRSYQHKWTRDNCTSFHLVFPNLQEFFYSSFEFGKHKNFDHLEYLASNMTMDSLSSVRFQIQGLNELVLATHGSQPINVRHAINSMFSGITNNDTSMESEINISETKAKSTYLQGRKTLRRPCIANLKGLRSFNIDFAIDDTFAEIILLQMKPLDKLTLFELPKISDDMKNKLAKYHKTVTYEQNCFMGNYDIPV